MGEEEIDRITGKWGLPGTNTSGQMLIDVLCAENDLIVDNTWFRKRSINKYSRLRDNERDRALLDYVLVRKNMKGSLKYVHVLKVVADGMSDHFLVETKMSLPRTRMAAKGRV